MADHLILSSPALGEPFLPPEIEAENNNPYWVTWTKPGSQETVAPDTKFIIKFNRPVDMTELSLANFKLDRVTTASPLQIQEVTTPFAALDLVYGYDSIARELTLSLTANLSANAEYFLTVQDLQDTTGAVQNADHVILFATAGTGTQYTITQPDMDTVVIEDHALVGPPVMTLGSTASVVCSILDGTLNSVAESLTLTYQDDVITSDIMVTEENLDTGAITVLTCTKEQDAQTHVVTVTLPYAAKQNCLYTVSAIYSSFQFMGVLTPFFVPLSDIAVYTTAPTADPITWARMVYIYSKEVTALLGADYEAAASTKAEAIKNYTKYLILSMFCTQSSNESIMLGELQISTGQRSGGTMADYLALLSQWEKELFNQGHPTKSVDVMMPRANEYHRVTGLRRQQLQRETGTFDKRLF